MYSVLRIVTTAARSQGIPNLWPLIPMLPRIWSTPAL